MGHQFIQLVSCDSYSVTNFFRIARATSAVYNYAALVAGRGLTTGRRTRRIRAAIATSHSDQSVVIGQIDDD